MLKYILKNCPNKFVWVYNFGQVGVRMTKCKKPPIAIGFKPDLTSLALKLRSWRVLNPKTRIGKSFENE